MDLQLIAKDLENYAWLIPRSFALCILLAIAIKYFSENNIKELKTIKVLFKNGWYIAFLSYLSIMLMGTIFARKHTIPYVRVLDNFGFREDLNWNKEIIENIVLYIPYSFLYLQAFEKKRSFISALLLSFNTSLGTETAQLVFWVGNFQLADVFHNTLGGIIGYLIWYLIKKCRGISLKKRRNAVCGSEKQVENLNKFYKAGCGG